MAEVEEITGLKDPPVVPRYHDFSAYECYWGGPLENLIATIVPMADQTPKAYEDAEQIDGLGEYAQYDSVRSILEVWKQPWVIVVSPITGDLARTHKQRDASVELARLILTRLD